MENSVKFLQNFIKCQFQIEEKCGKNALQVATDIKAENFNENP